jgi:hypothetical protein
MFLQCRNAAPVKVLQSATPDPVIQITRRLSVTGAPSEQKEASPGSRHRAPLCVAARALANDLADHGRMLQILRIDRPERALANMGGRS